MRALWKGYISFGLVTIPVRLYAATEAKDVRFNLLHARCGTRIRYKRWCETCDVEVDSDDIVKGYPWGDGRYVTLTDQELEDLPVPALKTVAIRRFVDLKAVDPIYFDRSYFLEPDDGGGNAYALLREAMQQTGRVGIAKVALRNRESLACVRVYRDQCLALETMHFADEIRPPEALNLNPPRALDEQERTLAKELVERLSGPFEPEAYRDEYREALRALIAAKAEGETLTVSPQPAVQPIPNLIEALRASLGQLEPVGSGIRPNGRAEPQGNGTPRP